MSRAKIKLGDLFSVPLDGGAKKFFQYVANDATQLNSDVIRAFKAIYPSALKPELPKVVASEVDFHAHVAIAWGMKLNFWQKVGNAPISGEVTVLFWDTNDYGDKTIKISTDWYVWKVNQEFRSVGRLQGDLQQSEIGIVFAPERILARMRTGDYGLAAYPKF